MPCNFNDYASETLFWDAMNFKVYHPKTINYSWQTLPGGKIINWDTNQNYTVQNPSNYSYSIYPISNDGKYQFENTAKTHNVIITGAGRLRFAPKPTSPGTFTLTNQGNLKFSLNSTIWVLGVYLLNQEWLYSGYAGSIESNSSYKKYKPQDLIIGIEKIANSDLYEKANTLVKSSTIQLIETNITWKLKIIDNGIISEYTIIDKNSVNVITLPSNNKEIIINGNHFTLLDESTIELVCTDPIYERCPPWTIECECDGQLCCYQPTDYGWRLVKTINLN